MTNLTAEKNRIQSIDILRGAVMIVMALDHVRDFFHSQASLHDPTDMATTTPYIFFTRWITHFCAPVFLFLSGTSAFLAGGRRTKGQLASFLMIRGIWLLFVEVAIISLGWTFDPLYHVFILQVIWAIGISMFILGLLVLLPYYAILAFGLIVVLGHNLLDYAEADHQGPFPVWWNLAHHGFFTFYPIAKGHVAILVYAFLPWTGIMALGYCAGAWFRSSVDAAVRRRNLIGTGLMMIAIFIILRCINLYGDRAHWATQKNSMYTFLSFLNTTKYPPSLLYICMTIGPALVILAWLEKVQNKFTAIINVYGRVPFFYYILHFYFIHTICVIVFYWQGYTSKDIAPQNSPLRFRPDHFGFGLLGVYTVWILIVVLLYPLCRWYNKYKSTHKHWWLSYL
jgi:uncharacterized membrane protein